MDSVFQATWFSTFKAVNYGLSPTNPNLRNGTFKSLRLSFALGSSNAESSSSSSSNSQDNSSDAEAAEIDPLKLAFAKANAYKKAIKSSPVPNIGQNPVPEIARNRIPTESAENGKRSGGSSEIGDTIPGNGRKEEIPIAVKLAMERAKDYKKDKRIVNSSRNVEGSEMVSGFMGTNMQTLGNGLAVKEVGKKQDPKISSIDFVGLEFSDKKRSRGLPAGLVPVADPFAEEDLPEVEIIVGDASKFGDAAATEPKPIQEDSSDTYKPKVSTWGVFPRPSNISKTYGGGRTIRPGEELETAEDKAANEARTRQLLAAYKRKMGLKIDQKVKSECEKALNDGDCLMDHGKLKEAIPFYENVMGKLEFQTELHGLAALQWSICQDSLSRPNEARVMYERLQSHPNVQVSKKAKQFMFGFQAMEMLKVTSLPLSPASAAYQNYFDAFVEDKPNYTSEAAAEDGEGPVSGALPYVLFLLSPIVIILLMAVQKRI